MEQSLEELQSGITAIVDEVASLKESVAAEKEQAEKVLAAFKVLKDALDAAGNKDFTPQVTALAQALTDLKATHADLISDNQAVEDALASVKPPEEPPVA